MKMFPSYPGCHEVQNVPAESPQSLAKGRMLWYNILGDNEGNISYLLRFDHITAGSILLTATIIFSEKEKY